MKPSYTKPLSITILVLMGAYFVSMMLLTPLVMDDMNFWNIYLEVNGYTHFSLKGLLNFWAYEADNDCVRLSNIAILAGTLGQPATAITKILIGLCMPLTALFIGRFAQNKTIPDPLLLLILWAGFILFLPWREFMFTQAFASNYIVATVLLMTAWVVARRSLEHNSLGVAIGGFLLVTLVAFWHEGFGVPLACGLLFVALLRKLKVPAWWWFAIVAAFAAVIIQLQFHGMVVRMARESIAPAWKMVPALLALSICVPVAILLTAVASLPFRKGRKWMAKHLQSPTFAFLAAVTITAAVISANTNFEIRTGYLGQTGGIACFAILLWPWVSRLKNIFKIIITVVLIVGLSVQAVTSLVWQNRYRIEFNELINKIPRNQDFTIYHDLIMPEDVTYATLNFCTRNLWIDTHLLALAREHKGSWENVVTVVPTALDRLDLAEQPVLDSIHGISIVDGVIYTRQYVPDVMKYSASVGSGRPWAAIKLKDGRIVYKECFEAAFFDRCGNKYYYIKPFRVRPEDVAGIEFANVD